MIGTLMEQDEVDRRAMQLVGVSPNEKTTVNIDPNCLSCLKSSANQ